MNFLNATIFALVGTAMEVIPALFPSWFPRNCADQASARLIWLNLMGAAQIALGVGYVIRVHLIPAFVSIVAAVPSGESVPLPAARALTGN
jgi:hypothetical protein